MIQRVLNSLSNACPSDDFIGKNMLNKNSLAVKKCEVN